MGAILASIGGTSLQIARDAGGMAIVLVRILRALLPPRIDVDEVVRALRSYGEASLPIVVVTAALTGVIMVLQAGVHVADVGANDMIGWFSGFATFREVGPMMIALMFSGRVGASNASELATMRITEQLDALRILAIDVYEVLVIPRGIAMVVALAGLTIFGDVIAIATGALAARVLIGVSYHSYFVSIFTGLQPGDFLFGVEKAVGYGCVVAVVSSHFGLSARGGSSGVGRAVNAQVVGCAVGIFIVDYMLTSVL
jgi:phospholipid/cholesterol/gamma-HCH transport system permease protein